MSDERTPSAPDLTHKRIAKGVGHFVTRMCFTCNKPKSEHGGAINKRTRMWSCIACITKAKPCL